MRSDKRIEPFLKELGEIWKTEFPDWRFSQLIVNIIREYGDPFYLEEDQFLKLVKDCVKKWKSGK